MAGYDLSNRLVIGIASSALFNLDESGRVFNEQGPAAYLAYQREHLDDTPLVRIPAGPPLKLGMRDERVPLVRARLGLGPSEEPVFDRSTALALTDFQKKAGLPANGILSERTLAALGKPASARGEEDIVAQMERWRWLPPDLGTDHIMVNVPEMRVRKSWQPCTPGTSHTSCCMCSLISGDSSVSISTAPASRTMLIALQRM